MLTYKDAGVDKEAGYKEVALIKEMIKSTANAGSVSDIGGFAGLYRAPFKDMKDPILVSGTDGVGTKVELAFKMDRHDTIGQDAVAMCVNDVLCQGATPMFFLDYIATGHLIPEKMAQIVSGVVEGCKQAGCALIGGETAEMPGIYQKDHYDLAGFCVGIVDRQDMITGKDIEVGDVLIGLPSSGVHSNGYSLVRKIVFDKMGYRLEQSIEDFGTTLGEELLKPTKIYVKTVLKLIETCKVKGISHITGGGVYENIPRVLKEGQAAYWNLENYAIPIVFQKLQEWGNVPIDEMFHTFNMGVGMVLIIAPSEVEKVQKTLQAMGEDSLIMGEVIEGEGVKLCHQKP